MGKADVFEYLLAKRLVGDDKHYSYTQIHKGMRRAGACFSYVSVWRSTNSLYSDDLVEAKFKGSDLQRKATFRARVPSGLQSLHMKKR